MTHAELPNCSLDNTARVGHSARVTDEAEVIERSGGVSLVCLGLAGLTLAGVTITSCGLTEGSTQTTTPATPVGADDELVSRCLVAADSLDFDDFTLVAAVDGGLSPGAGEVGLVCTIALTDGELASIFAPRNSAPRVIEPPSP